MVKSFNYEEFKKNIRGKLSQPRGQSPPGRPLLASLKNRTGGNRMAAVKPPELKR